jgi:hypothetical protein
MVDDTGPGNVIDDITDYVNELSEITGTASDTPPGTIGRVEVSIKRDSDGYYWKGGTDSWASSAYWNNAHAIDDSWNELSEDWEYTDLPAWEEGETYSIRARAIDKAWNIGSYDSESFTYDTTKPDTTIDDIPDYVNTLTEVTGTANDTYGGVAGVEVLIQRDSDDKHWDGANWVVSETWIDATASDDAFDSDNEDWEISTETTPQLPTWANGVTYDIEARAENVATSVDPTPATQSFTYDTTKPGTTIDDIADYVNTLTEVTGTANDTSPGVVAGVEVLIQRDSDDKYWDGANWVVSETWIDATASDDAFDSASEAWEITAATSPALPTTWGGGETYNIKARAKDAAENVDLSPATVVVTIGRGGLSWWHWVLIALGGIILIGGIILLIRLLRLKGPPPEEAQPEKFEF